jgi:hypothetical protein
MLWMAKLPPKYQLGVVFGGYIGIKLLSGMTRNNPALEVLVLPIIIVYAVFALFTWLAQPIFNLLLRLHPYGRHALAPNDRAETNWFAGIVALSAALIAWGWFGPVEGLWIAALQTLLLAIPIRVAFACSPGWPRWVMTGASVAMALLVVVQTACYIMILQTDDPALVAPIQKAGEWYRLGMFGTMIGGQMLTQVRLKR